MLCFSVLTAVDPIPRVSIEHQVLCHEMRGGWQYAVAGLHVQSHPEAGVADEEDGPLPPAGCGERCVEQARHGRFSLDVDHLEGLSPAVL